MICQRCGKWAGAHATLPGQPTGHLCMCFPLGVAVLPAPTFADQAKDAERYRLLRRGQHWSVINGIGDTLRADQLDAAIDAELATHNVEFSGTPAALSPEAPSRLPGSGTGDK